MSCYHPLKGFILPPETNKSNKVKLENEDKKNNIKVTGYNVHHLELDSNGHWKPAYDDFRSPYAHKVANEYIDIPCGKCIGCRLDYSRQWADRLMMEMKYHDKAYFLTLTYDDDHIPYNHYVTDNGIIDCPDVDFKRGINARKLLLPAPWLDEETGETGFRPSLHKRDVQLFHKRLREDKQVVEDGQAIRYFTAGEYGDKTLRPHYHSIEFGLEIPDLKVYKVCDGYNLYTSEYLNEIWKMGHVIIGDCTWETCAYTARYIMKKQKGKEANEYLRLDIEPEFVLMSRKPGIGSAYFEEFGEELYHFRTVPIPTKTGAISISSTNKYFDGKLSASNPERFDEVKQKRIEAAKHTEILRDAQTSMNKLDRLLAEEEVKIAQTKSLIRLDN